MQEAEMWAEFMTTADHFIRRPLYPGQTSVEDILQELKSRLIKQEAVSRQTASSAQLRTEPSDNVEERDKDVLQNGAIQNGAHYHTSINGKESHESELKSNGTIEAEFRDAVRHQDRQQNGNTEIYFNTDTHLNFEVSRSLLLISDFVAISQFRKHCSHNSIIEVDIKVDLKTKV